MKFYRVHFHTEGGNSAGSCFVTSLRDARREKREWDEWQDCPEDTASIEVIRVGNRKADILLALNIYASHPDNG